MLAYMQEIRSIVAQAALAEALNTSSTQTSLNLNSLIGYSEVQALAEALKTNSILTALNLHSNLIGDNGGHVLEPKAITLVFDHFGDTEHLDWRQRSPGASDALKSNSTLSTLDLSCNLIGDTGALALAQALKVNSSLTTLNLWRNPIRENRVQVLSKALETSLTQTTF
ncbi:hypothetical protein BGZ81_001686 [Podila clonocystis]|nr:hypothetical protein BGZ81_001686 [Podila clonocystis]